MSDSSIITAWYFLDSDIILCQCGDKIQNIILQSWVPSTFYRTTVPDVFLTFLNTSLLQDHYEQLIGNHLHLRRRYRRCLAINYMLHINHLQLIRRFMQHSQLQDPCDVLRLHAQPRIKWANQQKMYQNIKRLVYYQYGQYSPTFQAWAIRQREMKKVRCTWQNTDLFIFRFVSLVCLRNTLIFLQISLRILISPQPKKVINLICRWLYIFSRHKLVVPSLQNIVKL